MSSPKVHILYHRVRACCQVPGGPLSGNCHPQTSGPSARERRHIVREKLHLLSLCQARRLPRVLITGFRKGQRGESWPGWGETERPTGRKKEEEGEKKISKDREEMRRKSKERKVVGE